MPKTQLKVALLRHTVDMEELVALAAKLCYSKADLDTLQERIARQDQGDFIRRIMDMGHSSVMEHGVFTFGVEGVSRVCLAQLTRHRIASFSVQSQRYNSYAKGFSYIIPPAIEALGGAAVEEYAAQMDTLQSWYQGWQEKLGAGEGGNEDARFVLPNACETKLVMTMNVRELLHFFSLRMCHRAQWEIRAMATQMHRLAMEVAPLLFENAGPGCLRGPCPEGEKTCGRAGAIRAARREWIESIAATKEV